MECVECFEENWKCHIKLQLHDFRLKWNIDITTMNGLFIIKKHFFGNKISNTVCQKK